LEFFLFAVILFCTGFLTFPYFPLSTYPCTPLAVGKGNDPFFPFLIEKLFLMFDNHLNIPILPLSPFLCVPSFVFPSLSTPFPSQSWLLSLNS